MDERPTPESWCPSADPGQRGSVMRGASAAPRLGYLTEPRPVSDEVLEIAGPVAPTEVFWFTALCAGSACGHFDSARCRLRHQGR